MVRKVTLFLFSVLTISTSYAQLTRPVRPDIFEAKKVSAFAKRAAYGAFISEACGFASTIPTKYNLYVDGGTDDDALREQLKGLFRDFRRQHASGGNALSTIRPCHIEAAKTRVLIADITSEIEDLKKENDRKLSTHRTNLEKWQKEIDRLAELEDVRRREEEGRKQAAIREAAAAAERIPQKIHSALDCASNFGSISGVQVTLVEPAGDRMNVRGKYTITTFDIPLPGTFIGVISKTGQIESLWWKENTRTANVTERCLS